MKKFSLFLMAQCMGMGALFAQFQNAVPPGTPYIGFTHLGTTGSTLEEKRFNADNAIATSIKASLAPANITTAPSWTVTPDSKIKFRRYMYTNGTNARRTTVADLDGSIDTVANQRLVVVRPNDTLVRPCIFITKGGGFTALIGPSLSYFIAADFAAKGYVAVFYEYRTGWSGGPLEFEKASYRALQDAIAAVQFTLSTPGIHADASYLFATGESAGGITTLNLGLADAGNSFTGANFSGGSLGAFTSRSSFPNRTFSMKTIVPWASCLEDTAAVSACSGVRPQTGVILDAGDASTKVWFLHGSKDPLTNPENGAIDLAIFNNPNPYIGSGRYDTICTNGPKVLKTKMDALGIPNRTVMICDGGHGVSVDLPPSNPFSAIFFIRQFFDLMDYTSFACWLEINSMALPVVPNNMYTLAPQANVFVNTPPFGYMVNSQPCVYEPTDYMQAINDDVYATSMMDLTSVPDELKAYQALGIESNVAAPSAAIIYPNPTDGRIVVEQGAVFKEIQVMDVTGKQLMRVNTGNVNRAELDLSGLANGIYLIKTNTGALQKIVKQ